MPWRRCRGRRLWRERIAPPYQFQEEFYLSDYWPGDSDDLMAWWRPETFGGVASGTAVSSTNQWLDSSGNGRDASPFTAVKPVWHTNVQNGLGAVRFAGTTDILAFPHIDAASEWTVFAALGGLDVATNQICYCIAQTGAGTIVGGWNATYGFLGELQDLGKYVLSTVKPTAWGIDCWQRQHVYRDNVEVSYSATVGTLDRLDFRLIGGRDDVANLGTIGDIGEVLIYTRDLPADERTDIYTYLKHRWNTP